MVLTDTHAGNWNAASSGTLATRWYQLQNWRADVVATTIDNGDPYEYIRYSPYGIPTSYPAADANRNGTTNGTDTTDMIAVLGGGSAAVVCHIDLNKDGLYPDTADIDYCNDESVLTGKRGGFNKLGTATGSVAPQRFGYAGYAWDPAIKVYHVRHRVYSPEIGRWLTRDPIEYIEGVSLLAYTNSSPHSRIDPYGTCSGSCSSIHTLPIFSQEDGPCHGQMLAVQAAQIALVIAMAAALFACAPPAALTPLCWIALAEVAAAAITLNAADQQLQACLQQTTPQTPKLPTYPSTRPHYVTTCANNNSTSMQTCVNCCQRNWAIHYHESCSLTYFSGERACNRIVDECAHLRCHKQVVEQYNACQSASIADYNQCVSNCSSRWPGQPYREQYPIVDRPALVPILPPHCLVSD